VSSCPSRLGLWGEVVIALAVYEISFAFRRACRPFLPIWYLCLSNSCTICTIPSTIRERLHGIQEYLLVVFTRQNDNMLVPPGWFHVVYTPQAGQLLGTDFITIERGVEALVDEWILKASEQQIAG